jgi:ferredoxin-NADP reductase
MTAALLLLCIVAALLTQIAAATGWALVRRSRRRAAPAATRVAAPPPMAGLAWQGWREFRVAAREFADAAHTQCSFRLQPVDGLPLPPFEPGQYLTFSLSVPDATGAATSRPITRCYSLSAASDPGHYQVTVKRVAGGQSSCHFHDRLQVGDVLQARAPAGRFVLDPDPARPAVMIAGGIGITPLCCMLQARLASHPDSELHLYYGVRDGSEHAFRDALAALARAHPNFRSTVAYSRPRGSDVPGVDYQHGGYVDLTLLQRTLPPNRYSFYVCGPPAMMASLLPALRHWGVHEPDLHFEAFGPASAPPPPAGATPPAGDIAFEVRFARSGRTLTWDGQDASLLDFAERHAIPVESGCRSGSCGSCEVQLVSGVVRYRQDPDHVPTAGACLPCVGTPASALVLEA